MRFVRIGLTLSLMGLFAVPASAQTEPITCFGRAVTILGTEAKETLWGTEGPDVMHGLGQGDSIIGTPTSKHHPDRKDYICGGDANDWISGQFGHDVLDGQGGDDQVDGYEGNDTIFGGQGNDELDGLTGSDYLDGGEGADRLWNSNDHIGTVLGESSDVIHGGEGGDLIMPHLHADGSDELYGDAGHDKIYGTRTQYSYEAPGLPDLIDGGAGYDRCFPDPDDTVINCEEVKALNCNPRPTCRQARPVLLAQGEPVERWRR